MTASNLLATAQVSHSIEYSSGTGPLRAVGKQVNHDQPRLSQGGIYARLDIGCRRNAAVRLPAWVPQLGVRLVTEKWAVTCGNTEKPGDGRVTRLG